MKVKKVVLIKGSKRIKGRLANDVLFVRQIMFDLQTALKAGFKVTEI